MEQPPPPPDNTGKIAVLSILILTVIVAVGRTMLFRREINKPNNSPTTQVDSPTTNSAP